MGIKRHKPEEIEMPPFFGHLPVRFSSFHVIQNTPFPA